VVYFEVVEVHVEFYSGRPSENTPRERASRRWQDDAKMDLKEMAYEVVDWIPRARNVDKRGLLCTR
jgi:hypothetical protein